MGGDGLPQVAERRAATERFRIAGVSWLPGPATKPIAPPVCPFQNFEILEFSNCYIFADTRMVSAKTTRPSRRGFFLELLCGEGFRLFGIGPRTIGVTYKLTITHFGVTRFFAFLHRASTALRPCSLNSSADKFCARFFPPFRPSATAAGSFLTFFFVMTRQ